MYCLIENGEITRYNIEFPAIVNGVNFSKESSLEDALANGLYPVVGNEPEYDPARQRLTGPQYEFDGSRVNRRFGVEQIPDEEKATQVRAQRNALLKECDWTQGRDISEALSASWADYRQALRDLPEQAGFPWEVNWPTQPE